jgi:mono/diheme cytochrome c family protein
MKALMLAAMGAAALAGQDIYERGAEVFRRSCAQGYCHGTAGAQGRAPRLTGRNYEQGVVAKIVRDGVPNTGMPGFRNQLGAEQLEAVVAYVVRISGGNYVAGAGGGGVTAAAMPVEAAKGKALFFDATRGVKRCGTCHAVEGMGTPVGPNLAVGATAEEAVTIAAIRRGRGAGLRLARVDGEAPFAALVVEQTREAIRLYDLTAIPPVLRTIAKGEVQLSGGAQWAHSAAVDNYTDEELRLINQYLRWLAAQ